jgi:septal ring-binding cell division protein DamX
MCQDVLYAVIYKFNLVTQLGEEQMSKISKILGVFVLATMILAACAPATTPPPVPTEAPATVAPTEAPTQAATEAPTQAATEAPAATCPEGKFDFGNAAGRLLKMPPALP